MKKTDFYSYINYAYLSLVILWEPLQKAFIHVDGQGRILAFSTIAVFAFNYYKFKQFRQNTFQMPSFILLLLICYSAVNLKVKGYYVDTPFFYFFMLYLFKQFVIFQVTMIEAQKKPIALCRVLLAIFTLYAVLAATVLSGGGSHEGREYGALGNMAPLTVMYIAFFASLLYIAKSIKLSTVVMLVGFALSIIVAAATRKALGAIGIMLLCLLLSQIDLKPKNIVLVLFGSLFIYFMGNFILDNTFIGERFAHGAEEGAAKNTTDIWWLSFLGDRVVFYINGWNIFLDNWLTGIGIRNYLYLTASHHVLHTEYMVQLTENGLVGFTLFIFFNGWFLKKLVGDFLRDKLNRSILLVMLGAIGSILFICLTAWIYSFPQYFIVYGIVAGLLLQNRKLGRNNGQ